jgi:hypothetical protein
LCFITSFLPSLLPSFHSILNLLCRARGEPRASHILSKCSTTEQQFSHSSLILNLAYTALDESL